MLEYQKEDKQKIHRQKKLRNILNKIARLKDNRNYEEESKKKEKKQPNHFSPLTDDERNQSLLGNKSKDNINFQNKGSLSICNPPVQ